MLKSDDENTPCAQNVGDEHNCFEERRRLGPAVLARSCPWRHRLLTHVQPGRRGLRENLTPNFYHVDVDLPTPEMKGWLAVVQFQLTANAWVRS
jgi:hypothetical protein